MHYFPSVSVDWAKSQTCTNLNVGLLSTSSSIFINCECTLPNIGPDIWQDVLIYVVISTPNDSCAHYKVPLFSCTKSHCIENCCNYICVYILFFLSTRSNPLLGWADNNRSIKLYCCVVITRLILLQKELFQFIGRSVEECGRFSVSSYQLFDCGNLGGIQLTFRGWPTSLWLHAEVCWA